MTVKEKLMEEIEQISESLLTKTLDYLLLAKKQNSQNTFVETSNSIWNLAQEFIKDLPEEEINKIPTDGALQHDHYIYGTPKIEV